MKGKGALLTDKQKGYGGYGFIPYPPFYFPLVLRWKPRPCTLHTRLNSAAARRIVTENNKAKVLRRKSVKFSFATLKYNQF